MLKFQTGVLLCFFSRIFFPHRLHVFGDFLPFLENGGAGGQICSGHIVGLTKLQGDVIGVQGRISHRGRDNFDVTYFL